MMEHLVPVFHSTSGPIDGSSKVNRFESNSCLTNWPVLFTDTYAAWLEGYVYFGLTVPY